MIILISGGSKSGKSTIAEKFFENNSPLFLGDESSKKFYIATMEPFGEDADMIIKRHRAQRRDKGFITIEQYTDIEQAPVEDGGIVLLECVGNLVANEMFSKNIKNPSKKILEGIEKLGKNCKSLVLVSNEVGSDGDYSEATTEYIKQMGKVNTGLAKICDVFIEAVFGIEILHKGSL